MTLGMDNSKGWGMGRRAGSMAAGTASRMASVLTAGTAAGCSLAAGKGSVPRHVAGTWGDTGVDTAGTGAADTGAAGTVDTGTGRGADIAVDTGTEAVGKVAGMGRAAGSAEGKAVGTGDTVAGRQDP